MRVTKGIEWLCFIGGVWDKNVSAHAHLHSILAFIDCFEKIAKVDY